MQLHSDISYLTPYAYLKPVEQIKCLSRVFQFRYINTLLKHRELY